MYRIYISGKDLNDLKKNVADFNNQLNHEGLIKVDGEKVVENKSVAEAINESFNMTEEVVEKAEERMTEVETPTVITSTNAIISELDSNGVPWDKRIHAATKTKKKDGTWKNKRGLESDVLAQVETELKQMVHQAANPPQVPAAPVSEATPVVTPQVEQPVNTPAPVVEAPAPVAPPQPNMGLGNGHSFETFKQNFPMIISSLISEGKIDQKYINQLNEHFGVTEIWNITDEDKAQVFEGFVGFGFIQKVG